MVAGALPPRIDGAVIGRLLSHPNHHVATRPAASRRRQGGSRVAEALLPRGGEGMEAVGVFVKFCKVFFVLLLTLNEKGFTISFRFYSNVFLNKIFSFNT